MFSGIIYTLASIDSVAPTTGGSQIMLTPQNADDQDKRKYYHYRDPIVGSSHAVMGTCLTLVGKKKQQLTFDISQVTLETTTLGSAKVGDIVNLEPALRVGDNLDGHLVSGHVDARGTIHDIEKKGDNYQITIEYPSPLAPYIAQKGSIAVDGVSLTINQVINNYFRINIIPHTWNNTCFSRYSKFTQVNLEIDMFARYAERILSLQKYQ